MGGRSGGRGGHGARARGRVAAEDVTAEAVEGAAGGAGGRRRPGHAGSEMLGGLGLGLVGRHLFDRVIDGLGCVEKG